MNAGTFDHILKMLFAVDDSEINIEGRPHTILAAIGVENAAAVETALAKLKAEFGLLPTDEIKWNGMKPVPQQKREALSHELLVILQKSIPLVVISEGRQKQTAAKRMATQIADYFAAHPIETGERLDLVFDESILSHESEYADFLRTLAPSPIVSATLGILHSHQSAAIQLADVWAGFNRLLTDIVLGRSNKKISVWDDRLESNIEVDLLNYICISLRYQMWGEVPPPPWNVGATRWQTIRHVVLPNSMAGILTGIILQVSRSAGETAPILFTGAAFYLPHLPRRLGDQCMALSMHLFTISTQVPNVPPRITYGTALVLLGVVLFVNGTSIVIRSRLRRRRKW